MARQMSAILINLHCFENKNNFDFTPNFLAFTIPIWGQYIKGCKNVSHTTLSMWILRSLCPQAKVNKWKYHWRTYFWDRQPVHGAVDIATPNLMTNFISLISCTPNVKLSFTVAGLSAPQAFISKAITTRPQLMMQSFLQLTPRLSNWNNGDNFGGKI